MAYTLTIPSQTGKLALITGASGGLGYETALALAGAGAEVILTARNPDKGQQALRQIQSQHPKARLHFAQIDLASLASIEQSAAELIKNARAIDILINNAGIMALPQRQTTVDGFEMQFGTNYLGHFALTARLLPLLQAAPQARVVNLSSLVHRQGRIDLEDLQGERIYRPWKAYSQSKLAMLMFSLELQRHSTALGWGLISNAAHPGWARTALIANGPGNNGFMGRLAPLFAPFFSHSAAEGALPTVLAATDPQALPYYGPDGFYESKGMPAAARIMPHALDIEMARLLWARSEQLTGIHYPTT